MANYPNPLTTRFLDGVIKERPDEQALRKTYIGTSLVPYKSVEEYELTWDVIKSANHIAGVYAMDGTPIPGTDPGFYSMMANVINLAAARKLEEQTVMTFREPGELALKSRVLRSKRDKAMRLLRSKISKCDDEVDTTVEYLIMQALQGSIAWPPTDNAGAAITPAPAYWGSVSPGFTLSLGFRAAFVQDIASLSGYNSRAGGAQNWQHASADPFLDLEVIRELITETAHINAYGSTLIMSASALSWMATRPNVLNWFRGTAAGGPATDKAAGQFVDYYSLNQFLETRLGYKVMTYDSVWTYETNIGSGSGETENSIRFLPINKMLVIPNGALTSENAYFATAPISGPNDAYKTGKQTWSEKMTKPPWSWEVGVQLKGFPIIKTTQELAVFTLW